VTQTADAVGTVQTNLNAYWSSRSVAYDAYQARPERAAQDLEAWTRAFSTALPEAPADVLDVGTGSGYVATLLARSGYRVTGTDLAEGMLERARVNAARVDPSPTILAGDAVAPDFPEASFDAVTNRYVLWTLREPRTALANWSRVLRPGGVLVVVDSTWFPEGLDASSSPEFPLAYDERAQEALPLAAATTIDDSARVIREAGFVDVTVTPLEEIYALDERYGVADDHNVQMQYLIRAVKA
jgi:ubiquinone/menaquinone biosynthesis C-methylase UbiE